MASSQDCDPKRGEPPSTSSPLSVEVFGWSELWCYRNNCVGDEIVKSADYRTAENMIVRAPVDSGNPKMNGFVIVFCYSSDLCEDKALYFLCNEGKFDIVHLLICCFSSRWCMFA